MEWDDFAPLIYTLLIVGAIVGILIVEFLDFEYNHVQNVPVKCWVDDKLVFDGRSACIDVGSSGANTNVMVKGGWYCQFPIAHYVSKNVKLEGSKTS